MQDSKLRHINVYPGVTHQLPSNSKNLKKDKTASIQLNSIVESEDNSKLVQDVSVERGSFKLDWFDLEQNNKTSGAQYKSEKNKISTVIQKKNKKFFNLVEKDISRVQPIDAIQSRKMQSNPVSDQTYDKPSSSRLLDMDDSTTLDMNNELVNETFNDYLDNSNLEGQLTDGLPEIKQSLSTDYNQLDEPILDTLLRDLTGIYKKMKIIALPLSSYEIYKVVLRGWDLWGPLLLCTFLAFNLHHSEGKDKSIGLHFADVFVLVWVGSCIVSLNYRLLSISSLNNQIISNQPFHSRSNTASQQLDEDTSSAKTKENSGDDIASSNREPNFKTLLSPPSIFQLMCVFGYCLVAPCFGLVLLKLFSFNRLLFERIVVGLVFAFIWPSYSAIRVLYRYQHPDKRVLAIYPIGLFYFILSCIIILNH